MNWFPESFVVFNCECRAANKVTNSGFVAPSGQVEPTLFESRISNGISTDRKKYTNLEEYDQRALELVQGNAKKKNCGSIEMLVCIIRDIEYQQDRVLAVYDTALPNNTAHAEIVCTEIPAAGTPGRKQIRATLRKKTLDACLHDGKVIKSSQIFASYTQSREGSEFFWVDVFNENDSCRRMIRASFLSTPDRRELEACVRSHREDHGIARRANAILLLDDGESCVQIAKFLYVDDDTIRNWYKTYLEGGWDALCVDGWKGGQSRMTSVQETAL